MAKHKSLPLFKNTKLEYWTHVHPIIPLAMWGPVILFLFYRTFFVHDIPGATIIGLAFVALLLWSFVEYMMHRFVFHIRVRGPKTKAFQYFFHGVHHLDPQDPTRLVMPPVASLCYVAVFWPTFVAIMGPVWAEPFLAFFLSGYLAYDYTHYATHFFTPLTAWGRFVKQQHMDHHYLNQERNMGVSNPLWDFVFGTFGVSPKKRAS